MEFTTECQVSELVISDALVGTRKAVRPDRSRSLQTCKSKLQLCLEGFSVCPVTDDCRPSQE